MLLLSLPFVQSNLAKHATKIINEQFGTNIVVKRIDLSWLGSVQLKNIEIRDHHKDTLIFVDNLKTSLRNAKRILDNKVDLGEASLDGIHFYMKTYKKEKFDNLSIFIESFENGKPKDSIRKPFILRCDKINLSNLTFKLQDNNKKNKVQFSAEGGAAVLEDFSILGPDVKMKVREMQLTDNRGVRIENLTTDFSYTRTAMLFRNTTLQTDNNSDIKGDIQLKYKRKDFVNFNDKVKIKAKLSKSVLSVKDLTKFYKELRGDDMLYFTANINGVLNNFSATNLRMTSKNGMKIFGDLGFVNTLNTSRGFVFDADIKNIKANYFQLKNVLPNLLGKSLPTEFQKLGTFSMNGILKVTPDQMEATLTVNSEIGTTVSDLQLTNIENIDYAEYEGEVEFKDVDVGILANDDSLGKVSLIADVKGTGFNVETINTAIIGRISKLEFNKYTYSNLTVNGEFQNKKFDGSLRVDDENVKLDFEGLADFSSVVNKFDFTAKVADLNLQKTNLFTRDSISKIKGELRLNISGNTFDDIVGDAKFKNLIYRNQKKRYVFKNFSIYSKLKDSVKSIEVNSDDIINGKLEGKFLFREFFEVTQNALGSMYTNYKPYKVANNQFLDFKFTIHNQIIDVFFPEISISDDTRLKGKIKSNENALKLTFTSPKIKLHKNVLDSVSLRMDNKNPLYNTYLQTGSLNTKYYNVKKFTLLNKTVNDTLFFKSIFKGGKENKQDFNLDFYYTINKESKGVLGIQKSNLNYQDNTWVVNPKNDKKNKVVFDYKENNYAISPVILTSDAQRIEFKGIIEGKNNKKLHANFQDVQLESLFPEIDSLRLQGKVNGVVNFKEEQDTYQPEADVSIKGLRINEVDQGDLNLKVTGLNSLEEFAVDLSLENKVAKSIEAKGILDFTRKRPIVDLNVSLKDYQIAAFSPLGSGVLSKLRGEVSGDFKAKGYLRNPDLEGVLSLNDVGLTFPYLNVDFDLKGNTDIELEGQQFLLQNITMEDTKHKTKGQLSGYIAYKDFEMWYLDLEINTDNMLILDTKEAEEVPYYGTGFLKGTAEITGLTSNLDILVEGKTQPNTKFVIPLSDVKTIDNYKLIHFEKRVTEKEEKQRSIEDIKGLDLKMRLEVTKDAVAQVVIDKVSGSELKGSGQGNLAIDINTRGKFNMFGDFKVDNGLYNFRYAGITKPFVVQKGGTISWNGSPYDAELDITAVYRTKANPAQVLDNVSSNRKIPIDLYTKITGGLFSSKQEFDIKIPNANSTVSSELEFILNENDLNKKMQHFSFLLAFGTFYDEEALGSSATAGLTGTASEIASSILSNMLNNENDKIQVGFNYTQGDRRDVDNLNTDDQVDFSVSTQLSDRVLVNGKVGVPVGANTQTSIIGEVKVEVLLNEEGNFRSTVFNRQNDVQYSVDDEGYTQGVGLSYQVNFNNLSELAEKIGLKKKKNDKKKIKIDSIAKEKNLIHFAPKRKKEN